jgi:hypothetical protein
VAEIAAVPKLLLVARRVQAFGAYEQGRLVRWGPVSTGKKSTPTPTGLFHTNWHARGKVSTENLEWLLPWYFNVHNTRGISFHQFDMPSPAATWKCASTAAPTSRSFSPRASSRRPSRCPGGTADHSG